MRVLLVISLLFGLHAVAQEESQNLVPNPSFEDTVHCPVITGNFGSAVKYWYAYGSSDYYRPCGLNGVSAPSNWCGYATPHADGDAYAGIAVWALPFQNFREYIAVKLTKPLEEGSTYKIKFYVSLSDSTAYAINRIGACVSKDSTSNVAYMADFFLSVKPDVEHKDSFLENKEDWDLVEGVYRADGDEQYLIIGNFAPDYYTDTLFVGGASENFNEVDFSYYYIDDVSLTLESATGIDDQSNVREISVYPNPNNGSMFIEYSGLEENSTLELYNSAGQIVDSYQLVFNGTGVLSINRTDLSAGIYTYLILENGMGTITDRVVIQ